MNCIYFSHYDCELCCEPTKTVKQQKTRCALKCTKLVKAVVANACINMHYFLLNFEYKLNLLKKISPLKVVITFEKVVRIYY